MPEIVCSHIWFPVLLWLPQQEEITWMERLLKAQLCLWSMHRCEWFCLVCCTNARLLLLEGYWSNRLIQPVYLNLQQRNWIWKEGKIKQKKKKCLDSKQLSKKIEDRINSKQPWILAQLGRMRNSILSLTGTIRSRSRLYARFS